MASTYRIMSRWIAAEGTTKYAAEVNSGPGVSGTWSLVPGTISYNVEQTEKLLRAAIVPPVDTEIKQLVL
jgi:hypothetical protein